MSERKISINEIQGTYLCFKNHFILHILYIIFIYYIILKIQNQKKYYNFLKYFKSIIE